MPDWHDLDIPKLSKWGSLGGGPGYARNAGYFDMSSPAFNSPFRSSGRTPYLPITLRLACFIAQPNRP